MPIEFNSSGSEAAPKELKRVDEGMNPTLDLAFAYCGTYEIQDAQGAFRQLLLLFPLETFLYPEVRRVNQRLRASIKQFRKGESVSLNTEEDCRRLQDFFLMHYGIRVQLVESEGVALLSNGRAVLTK